MLIFAVIAVAVFVKSKFDPATTPTADTWIEDPTSPGSELPAELPTLPIIEPGRPGPNHTGKIKQNTVVVVSDPPSDLGALREIRKGVFESAAGLLYLPGSADDHRIEHVMQHARDDLTKPVHGVFEADREQILALIDLVYQKSQDKSAGSNVRQEQQNNRLVITADMQRRIGYVGGQQGRRQGNPQCRYLRLILQNGNEVVTAYPTKSF